VFPAQPRAVRRNVMSAHSRWPHGRFVGRDKTVGKTGIDPGTVTNLFTRALMGAGAEVTVRHGQLMLKPLHPIPAIHRVLHALRARGRLQHAV